MCISHKRVHGCTFAICAGVCAGDECALACRQVHRCTRVCDVQRYQGDAENVQAGLPRSVSKCVCASISHSCAHLCKCTCVANLGEREGKEERRAGAPPPPQPCSQKSTSSSEVLISSQSVHGVHAAPAVHCPLSYPWSRVPSLDETLRQTTGQPWHIHTLF